MKKIAYILAAFAFVFASCTKEAPMAVTPSEGPETITFSATIDMNAFTKAELSTLDIHWNAGDSIGIVSNLGGKVIGYPVTPESTNPTLCSFSIAAVPGATTYYAIYTGSSDFSGISFDTSTATFSGLNTYQGAFGKGSHSGAELSMAGKTSSTALSMKPCLALVKLQVGAASVAAKYATEGGFSYSGVRGLYLYQMNGSSKLNTSGDYTVNLSGDNMVVASAGGSAAKNYKQINDGTSLMSSGTDYYMSLIPGGSITGFSVKFFGFDSGESPVWVDIYPMSLAQSTTVQSGDFFNLGTLDPVTLQKAIDSASALIVNDIDNVDWDDAGVAVSTQTGTDYTQLQELKVVADQNFVYVRFMTPAASFDANYFDFYFADNGTASKVYWPWTTYCDNSYNVEHAGAITSSGLTISYNSRNVETKVETANGNIYWFMSLPRTAHTLTTDDGTVNFGCRTWKDWAMVGLLPANGSAMLSVVLP